MSHLYHRENTILVNSNSAPAWGANYTVTVYAVGAVANAASADTTVPVDVGHSFRVGDKIYNANTGVMSDAISVVAAGQLTVSPGNFTVSSGDVLVNVGPDGGSGTPDWDSSPMALFSDPGGGTAVSEARVTCDSLGNYEYYYKGNGRAWEVVRDSSGTYQSTIQGFGGDPKELHVADYGAKQDGSDDSKAITAAELVADQYEDVALVWRKIDITSTDSPYTMPRGPALVTVDSSGGAMTGTLGNGIRIGDQVDVIMETAGNNFVLTVTNHADGDGRTFTFDAVDEFARFVWTGTEWADILTQGPTEA